MMIVEDENGKQIDYKMLGEIQRGDITEPIKLVLYNNEGVDRTNILIKGTFSKINQMGVSTDTFKSLFISLDGKNGELEKIVNIKAEQRIPFYLEYQPTWLAMWGNYQFSLLIKDLNV